MTTMHYYNNKSGLNTQRGRSRAKGAKLSQLARSRRGW